MRSWWNLPRYFWHPLTLLHKNAACSRDWLNNSTPALLEGSHWKLSSASWGTCIAYTWHHFALLRSLLAICPWILPMVSLLIYAHLISFQSQAWSCTQGDWGTSHFNHQSVRHVCKQTQILMTQLQHYNILHLYPLKRTTILEAKNIWGYMGKISWASTNFNQFQPISTNFTPDPSDPSLERCHRWTGEICEPGIKYDQIARLQATFQTSHLIP